MITHDDLRPSALAEMERINDAMAMGARGLDCVGSRGHTDRQHLLALGLVESEGSLFWLTPEGAVVLLMSWWGA